jgi:hypothetical protein
MLEVGQTLLQVLSSVQERAQRLEEELESLSDLAPSPKQQALLRGFYVRAQEDAQWIRNGFGP